jgi:hypothetical protein
MATGQEWFDYTNRERSVPEVRRLFAPSIVPERLERLRDIIERSEAEPNTLRWNLEQELARVNKRRRGKPGLMYATSLALLSDITGAGWVVDTADDALGLSPPDPFTVSKATVRAALQVERDAQLADKSTREFLNAMERPVKRGALGRTNIFTVLTDGAELVRRLQPAMAVPGEGRGPLLATLVRPVLELVEPGAKCATSGLSLQDIWRYVRHSWALPYFTTPGRQLLYLIRDEAHPNRPIIGIAGLTNAVAQLGPRDEFIGWTFSSIKSRLGNSFEEVRIYQALDLAVRTGIRMTRHDDLGLSKKDLSQPRASVVERLSKMANQAGEDRRAALEKGTKAQRIDEESDFWKQSASPLFRSKRADTMARLLLARMQLRKAKGPLPLSEMEAKDPELASRAISYALRIAKDARMGTAMLDISICGAIPPYNFLLGGKLVALMMMSPQVRKDYRDKYGGKPAIIASALRGKPVVRDTELVMLTTTSLYSRRSSQYNRLRVPAPSVSAAGDLEFKPLGQSRGWGSVHLSRRTRELLRELSLKNANLRNVNYVFGEGVNPKMRAIREGLNALGVTSDAILHHQQPRLVYGVLLAKNAREFLRMEEPKPTYLLGGDDAAADAERLADFWRRRWLAQRLDYRPAVDGALEWKRGPLLSSRRLANGLAVVQPDLSQLSLDLASVHPNGKRAQHATQKVMAAQSRSARSRK